MPGARAGDQVGGHQQGEDDLAEHVALGHRREPVPGLVHRQLAVDQRPRAGGVEQRDQRGQLVASAHRRADDRELEEEDAGQLGVVEVRSRRSSRR